jgi:hypothetical protein
MTKIHHQRAPTGVEIVEIHLTTGETIRGEGSDKAWRLKEDKEIDTKFLSCCDHAIGKNAAETLLGRLRRLEGERSLERIMALGRGEESA